MTTVIKINSYNTLSKNTQNFCLELGLQHKSISFQEITDKKNPMKSALHYFFLLPFCSQLPPQPCPPPPRQKTQTNNNLSQAKTKQMIQKIMLNWIRQSGCTEHGVQHPKNIIKLITCTITIMVLNVLQRKLSVPKKCSGIAVYMPSFDNLFGVQIFATSLQTFNFLSNSEIVFRGRVKGHQQSVGMLKFGSHLDAKHPSTCPSLPIFLNNCPPHTYCPYKVTK